MKKEIKKVITVIILIIGIVVCIMFLNSKFKFLPRQVTFNIGNYYINISNTEEIGVIDTSDYIMLSSLVDSPLLENMDLLVPKSTFIPNEEEVGRTYSGLYSDSVIASMTNTDIIIQNYGIEITEEMNLVDFREQIVSSLRQSRPDIEFDTSRTIKKDDLEIPIIEFSTKNGGHVTYSFIALVNLNGNFVTIAVNSAEHLLYATQFFETLLNNMVIK